MAVKTPTRWNHRSMAQSHNVPEAVVRRIYGSVQTSKRQGLLGGHMADLVERDVGRRLLGNEYAVYARAKKHLDYEPPGGYGGPQPTGSAKEPLRPRAGDPKLANAHDMRSRADSAIEDVLRRVGRNGYYEDAGSCERTKLRQAADELDVAADLFEEGGAGVSAGTLRERAKLARLGHYRQLSSYHISKKKRTHLAKPSSRAQLEREISSFLGGGSRTSRAHMNKAPALTPEGKRKDEVIAQRKTYDDKAVALWSDGSLTWGRNGTVIKGSPHARTPAQIESARRIGWLVLGEIEIVEAEDVSRLIAAARKVSEKSGLPGDVRREFHKDAPLNPHWKVIETDRNGRPVVRVWTLPRLTHHGIAVWDHCGGRNSSGGRYEVMQEHSGHRARGTYETTGVRFSDLASLSKHLRELSALNRR